MGTKKTLEEYQIQEIAAEVVEKRLTDFGATVVTKSQFDTYALTTDNKITTQGKEITTLSNAEAERVKDRKTVKYQITGIAIGFIFQFVVWAVIASNGFKIGAQ